MTYLDGINSVKMSDIKFISGHRVLNPAVSAEMSKKALGFPVWKDLSAAIFCLTVLTLTATNLFLVIPVFVRLQSLKRKKKKKRLPASLLLLHDMFICKLLL